MKLFAGTPTECSMLYNVQCILSKARKQINLNVQNDKWHSMGNVQQYKSTRGYT